MYLVLLRLTAKKDAAPQFMAAHNAWIKQGFDDGVFLMVGTLEPAQGGAVLAHALNREEITDRVHADPFVAEEIVKAEILEISPRRVDARLGFLMDAR